MAAPPAQHSSPNRSTYRVQTVCDQPATEYFRRVCIFVLYLLVISYTHTAIYLLEIITINTDYIKFPELKRGVVWFVSSNPQPFHSDLINLSCGANNFGKFWLLCWQLGTKNGEWLSRSIRANVRVNLLCVFIHNFLQSALQPLWVFGLLNYRWVFSAGRFLQSAVASGTSNPQLGGPVIRTFQLPPPMSPTSETTRANPSSVRWNCGREIAENSGESGDFHVTFGFFYMP